MPKGEPTGTAPLRPGDVLSFLYKRLGSFATHKIPNMPARTKARAKFDFRGRPFVWWIENDKYLRIASLDKRFVIAYLIGRAIEDPPVVKVIGPEFPGLESARRPLWFVVPEPTGVMGAWVDQLLRWSFNPQRPLISFPGPPRFW
jgi:hypothetical protein